MNLGLVMGEEGRKGIVGYVLRLGLGAWVAFLSGVLG
jgi:hypothetical protein